jgi:hypothetical protein
MKGVQEVRTSRKGQAGIGQAKQNRQNRTGKIIQARSGQAEQDRQNRQAKNVFQNRIGRTG